MHEWALAESVVKTVELNDEFKNKKIDVIVGELQDVDIEVFEFALNELMKNKEIKMKLRIVVEESSFKCNNCGFEFSMKEVLKRNKMERENIHFIPEMVKAFVKCPKCKSIDFEIIKGRGVKLSYE